MTFAKRAIGFVFLILVCGLADTYGSPIVFDPVGDRLTSEPGPYPDITSIQTTLSSDAITFLITFADLVFPIAPTGPPAPNMIAPRIDLDLDQNPATGFVPVTTRLTEFYGYPPLSFGTEYSISMGSSVAPFEARGLLEFNQVAFVVPDAVTWGPRSISVTLPLAVLNDDGLMNYAVFVFGGFAIPSDRAPNGTTPYTTADSETTPVPEPTSLLLLISTLGAFGAARMANRGSC